ncbi:helix-turn-helix domain-containing protein [Neisseria bacilliformis]|uniref:helix-turn-helix domain-containing protein n=1 Tax=Neisseria bacilliformis TaxID=267212 RepID=UPI00069EACCA|nr:helix-turn-helix domain-containing protein [Neisseria bacilliformis]
MYLLDTNVLSEIRKISQGKAHPAVAAWAERVDFDRCYLSVITLLEIEQGILRVWKTGWKAWYCPLSTRASCPLTATPPASALGCTEKSLTAACKQMSGATPKQLIAQRLTLEAKRLLAHSKQSVHQIAFSLGFNEPTNFIKFLKKYTALTPRQFRTAQKLGATR